MSDSLLNELLTELFPSDSANAGKEVLVNETVELKPIVVAEENPYVLDCRRNWTLIDRLEAYAIAKRNEDDEQTLVEAHRLVEMVLEKCTAATQERIHRILDGERRYSVTIRCDFEIESEDDQHTLLASIQSDIEDALSTWASVYAHVDVEEV